MCSLAFNPSFWALSISAPSSQFLIITIKTQLYLCKCEEVMGCFTGEEKQIKRDLKKIMVKDQVAHFCCKPPMNNIKTNNTIVKNIFSAGVFTPNGDLNN